LYDLKVESNIINYAMRNTNSKVKLYFRLCNLKYFLTYCSI